MSGAGISAESGLQTFRDSDGLWEGYSIHDVATPSAWARNKQLVLDFYNARRCAVKAAEPNDAHKGLAFFEQYFDVHIITQNIDDLHERAGSTKVLHLHGEIFKMCSEKNKAHITPIREDIVPGRLAPDGNQFRPFIVWFDEAVPLMPRAAEIVAPCDLFVVVGTSLVVYPAAGLVNCVKPEIPLYVIDKKIPPLPYRSNLFAIESTAGLGVKKLVEMLT